MLCAARRVRGSFLPHAHQEDVVAEADRIDFMRGPRSFTQQSRGPCDVQNPLPQPASQGPLDCPRATASGTNGMETSHPRRNAETFRSRSDRLPQRHPPLSGSWKLVVGYFFNLASPKPPPTPNVQS